MNNKTFGLPGLFAVSHFKLWLENEKSSFSPPFPSSPSLGPVSKLSQGPPTGGMAPQVEQSETRGQRWPPKIPLKEKEQSNKDISSDNTAQVRKLRGIKGPPPLEKQSETMVQEPVRHKGHNQDSKGLVQERSAHGWGRRKVPLYKLLCKRLTPSVGGSGRGEEGRELQCPEAPVEEVRALRIVEASRTGQVTSSKSSQGVEARREHSPSGGWGPKLGEVARTPPQRSHWNGPQWLWRAPSKSSWLWGPNRHHRLPPPKGWIGGPQQCKWLGSVDRHT